MFEFSETRNGENVREFLRLDAPQARQGTLVTDRFSGYRAFFDKGVTSAQCMAYARRKLHELWAALERSNWLFAGSLRAGKWAAAIMILLHTARINGHEPYAYLKDVLQRLPTQPASRIEELLPHRWAPTV